MCSYKANILNRYVVRNHLLKHLQKTMKNLRKGLNVRLITALHHVEGGLSALLGVNVVPKVHTYLHIIITNWAYVAYNINNDLVLDFNSTTGPPNFCGIDETTGEDMFCCSDTNGQSVTKLQPPQFPTASNEARPCVDHSTHCKRWAKNYPESCSPGHKSYIFMRETCQSSCKRCGDNVS